MNTSNQRDCTCANKRVQMDRLDMYEYMGMISKHNPYQHFGMCMTDQLNSTNNLHTDGQMAYVNMN